MSATAPQPASSMVKCSCPVCGDLLLPPSSFNLVVCASDPDRSFYYFTCTKCSTPVTKQASERVVLGLGQRGVPTQRMPQEALEARAGAPLTSDDLLDLHLALADDELVAAAVADLGQVGGAA